VTSSDVLQTTFNDLNTFIYSDSKNAVFICRNSLLMQVHDNKLMHKLQRPLHTTTKSHLQQHKHAQYKQSEKVTDKIRYSQEFELTFNSTKSIVSMTKSNEAIIVPISKQCTATFLSIRMHHKRNEQTGSINIC